MKDIVDKHSRLSIDCISQTQSIINKLDILNLELKNLKTSNKISAKKKIKQKQSNENLKA